MNFNSKNYYKKKTHKLFKKINQNGYGLKDFFTKKKIIPIDIDYNKELLEFVKEIESKYKPEYKNKIEDLLQKGANFFIFDNNDINSFNYTIIHKNIPNLEVFLEYYRKHNLKNDINIQNNLGKTAFYIACENNNLEAIKLIVHMYDMNPNIYDNMKKTPFLVACYYNFFDIVSFLTKIVIKNPELDDNDDNDNDEKKVENQEKIQKNKEFLLNFHLRDKNNQTPIHYAANSGNESLISYLLHFKDIEEDKPIIEWNKYDKFGDKPIHIAAKKGHQKIIEIFLPFIKNIYEKNKDGCTVGYLAAEYGQTNIIHYLAQFKYNFNIPENKYGQTPCFIAAKNNYRETLMEILRYGGNFNLATPESVGGFSPFYIALYNNNADIAKLLLTNEYMPRIRDFNFENGKILLKYITEWAITQEDLTEAQKQLSYIQTFYD